MLKLTFKDGHTNEYSVDYPAVYYNGSEWFFCLGFETDLYLELEKIVKIEKQVKDLTLVEMAQLHLSEKYTDSNFTELEGAVDLGTYKIYKLDDYVDITELIKKQVNKYE